jgi:4-amino-4-deoxy-L-arabinose transferase-like glycosyltransferase
MCIREKFRDKTFIYLLSILLFAVLLRIPALQTIPIEFNCDEAANGYESYSILKTLRDRYGNFLPSFFNIFGNDAREPIYIYLTIPFIKLFGLNEFSTRFPAALIGIFTVLASPQGSIAIVGVPVFAIISALGITYLIDLLIISIYQS